MKFGIFLLPLVSANWLDVQLGANESTAFLQHSRNSAYEQDFYSVFHAATSGAPQGQVFAGKFRSVSEMVDSLFNGMSLDYVMSFDTGKPFVGPSVSEIEVTKRMSYDQLEQELYGLKSALEKYYSMMQNTNEILKSMSLDDFLAVYEHISAKVEMPVLKNDTLDVSSLGEVEFSKAVDLEPVFKETDETVQASGIIFLIKLPMLIAKLIIAIIVETIVAIKSIIIVIDMITVYIISLIQCLCHIETQIIVQSIKLLKSFINLTIPYEIYYKVKQVFFIVLKYLQVLSWEVKDMMYRYKWKIIWFFKKSSKQSLIATMFFKDGVYDKIGSPLEEKLHLQEDFTSYDDDYYDWNDYDYIKEYASYIYKKPGTYPDGSEESHIAKEFERLYKEKKGKFGNSLLYADGFLEFDGIHLGIKPDRNTQGDYSGEEYLEY